MKVLIFLRQTERKDESNWKIDTISVVQETITNLEKSELVSSQTILHLINRLFWAIL